MSAQRISAVRFTWSFENGSPREPSIRIRYGTHFLIIPIGEGRKLSDQVHDICDEHERRATR